MGNVKCAKFFSCKTCGKKLEASANEHQFGIIQEINKPELSLTFYQIKRSKTAEARVVPAFAVRSKETEGRWWCCFLKASLHAHESCSGRPSDERASGKRPSDMEYAY